MGYKKLFGLKFALATKMYFRAGRNERKIRKNEILILILTSASKI